MSAFIVSTEHIDALVGAGLSPHPVVQGHELTWRHEEEWRKLNHSNADQVGSMLLSENVRSVEYRYSPPGREAVYGEGFTSGDDFQLPGRYVTESLPGIEPIETPEWLTPYTFTRPRRQFSPVEVLKLIECFDYQSCETADWPETEAYAFCQSLKDDMIGRLPGMREAAWSL